VDGRSGANAVCRIDHAVSALARGGEQWFGACDEADALCEEDEVWN